MEVNLSVVINMILTIAIVIVGWLIKRVLKGHTETKELLRAQQIELKKLLYEIKKETHELWIWHNKEDDDGVKVWYVRSSLERAITDLSKSITKFGEMAVHQTEVLSHLTAEIKEMKTRVGG